MAQIGRRRLLVRICNLGAVCGFSQPAPAFSQTIQSANVRLRVDDAVIAIIPASVRKNISEMQDTSSEAVNLRAQVPAARGVPVFFIVVGALSIPVIWQMILEMCRQYYYGGVIIDVRSSPPNIKSSKEIPPDSVFVILPSNQIQRYKSQEFSMDILKTALKGSIK